MAIKRKTLTLPRAEFFEPLKHLEPEIKHSVLDAILDFFFEDKSICYSDYDSPTRTALACIMPGLRRVQAQFDNGKSEKKLKQNTQGLFCPFEESQIEPNQANRNLADSSILYNNIINNNMINKQTINKQQLSADEMRKTEVYSKLRREIEKLKTNPCTSEQRATIIRVEDLITRLALEIEPQIVNRQPVAVADILERYLQAFNHEPQTTLKNLERIFSLLDEACIEKKITNSYKYLIALFYNQALIQPHIKTSDSFEQRHYTSEEMNSLFDNLDDISI